MEEKETFIDQEKKFLKGLLEKYRSENPKEEINRSKKEQEERAEKIEKQLMEDYDNFFKIN